MFLLKLKALFPTKKPLPRRKSNFHATRSLLTIVPGSPTTLTYCHKYFMGFGVNPYFVKPECLKAHTSHYIAVTYLPRGLL